VSSETAPEDALERIAHYQSYDVTPDAALELFDDVRPRCPVPHSDQLGGHYLLLEYDAVKSAHVDWQAFSSEPNVMRPLVMRPQFPPLEYDPPEHKKWRAIFGEVLNTETPKTIEGLVRADAVRLIEQFAANASVDLIEEYAEPLPLMALCHLIGFDDTKRAEVRRLTIELDKVADDPERLVPAFIAFAEFGAAEVMKRKDDPRDDFLTVLSRYEFEGEPLNVFEIGGVMISFLHAGHGTTVSALGSLLYEILTRPDVRQALLRDPGLIPNAVEESLRLHTPFFGLYRRATRDLTVAETEIPDDASVFLCWAAANRDPAAFDEPTEFQLTRDFKRRRHLTFGFGIHACMGQPLARMQLRVAVEELLARLPDIELVDPAAVRHTFGGGETCQIEHMPATFRRTA
jgi:cytochrome P450